MGRFKNKLSQIRYLNGGNKMCTQYDEDFEDDEEFDEDDEE